MKRIVLLGSTGSIGRNVIDVVGRYPDKFSLEAISSYNNADLLLEQAAKTSPKEVVIGNEESYKNLRGKTKGKFSISAGSEELKRIASLKDADIIFIAISGIAALGPLVAAIKAGKKIALASKEPIVSAGEVIMKMAKEYSAQILPVDSEHSAILQCLEGKSTNDVRNLYITGTGGSLKDLSNEELDNVSLDRVLAHPKWNMGPKITVDSATLMNKGLEVIEARWLFDIPKEKIKVVIHPEAIIHSMVEFNDGTINAVMFTPDMRFPILKALSYPDIFKSDFPRVDFSSLKNFSFSEPDLERFPALEIAFEALAEGGTLPAVLNGANEAAVNAFLNKKIEYKDIIGKVTKTLSMHKKISRPSLEEIIDAEKWAYEEVEGNI